MQPKVTYYDQILSSKNTTLTTQIAKDYEYSAQKFNKLLESLHIQYRLRGQWLLYVEHAGNGYTKSVSIPFEYNDGTCEVRTQSEWTQRGRLFLYEKLKANNILPTIEK
jgi:anti-repressor protein